jgi:hypothetical protein
MNMDKITLNIGETKTAYFFINLSGRVYFKVQNQSKTNTVMAWWIKGPFGLKETLPNLVSGGSVPLKGVVWGKLKVSGADSETIIYITDQASIATQFPKIEF